MNRLPRHRQYAPEPVGFDDPFVDWAGLISISLTPELLEAVEQSCYASIDRRYPNNPRSWFNSDYRYGQRLKRRYKAFFTEAHERLVKGHVDQIEQVRWFAQQYQLRSMDDWAYDRRRDAQTRQFDDAVDRMVRQALAEQSDVLANIALESQRSELVERTQAANHRRSMELVGLLHKHTLELERARADIEALRYRMSEPRELTLKLLDVLTSLSQFQMTLIDRAARNPVIHDRLKTMALGVMAVSQQMQQLLADLADAGPETPTPEQRRQQAERLLAMAMDQMLQWQQDIQAESTS